MLSFFVVWAPQPLLGMNDMTSRVGGLTVRKSNSMHAYRRVFSDLYSIHIHIHLAPPWTILQLLVGNTGLGASRGRNINFTRTIMLNFMSCLVVCKRSMIWSMMHGSYIHIGTSFFLFPVPKRHISTFFFVIRPGPQTS